MAHWLKPALVVGVDLVLRATFLCIVLVRRRDEPATRLTWIILILALPFVGVIAYILVGEVRLGRKRIARHREIVERIKQSPDLGSLVGGKGLMSPIMQRYQSVSMLAESVGDNDVLNGNELTLIGDSQEFIDRLVADIDAAVEHCHLLFYIYLPDGSGRAVGEALMRAAGRGVTCRLLVDGVGSKAFLRSSLKRDMERAGVHVVEALPANALRMLFERVDLRNHRKIVVIDGSVSYTGSQNIADAAFAPKKKFAPWVDAAMRIRGPITWDLQLLFIEDWYLDTDESLESMLAEPPESVPDGVPAQVIGTGPDSFNEALRLVVQVAFGAAREELILTTPYFVPDLPMLSALRVAARRGVNTSLIVPARNDSPLVAAASRSFYEPLLDAGVSIYEFGGGLLHAKTLTVDRELAIIGTANMDRRSFDLNFEVNIVVYDSDFASYLRFLQMSYIEKSVSIDGAKWKNRSFGSQIVQNAAGTMSPLL